MLNTNFEMEKTMGSKISIQDIDQKASDFAKANFMKQLKEHHQNLEKENKELKQQTKEQKQKLVEEAGEKAYRETYDRLKAKKDKEWSFLRSSTSKDFVQSPDTSITKKIIVISLYSLS